MLEQEEAGIQDEYHSSEKIILEALGLVRPLSLGLV